MSDVVSTCSCGCGPDGEWEECDRCMGRGIDNSEPDGTCVECFGHGERFVVYVDDDSDDDFEVSA